MALKSLLMTAQEVKTAAFTQAKFDTGLILDNVIRVSQLKHLEPVLTKDLYELIETQNDASTLTSANSILLNDYIKPALAYAVRFEALPSVMTKVTNIGIQVNNTEFGGSVSSAAREELREDAREHMQTFLESMIVFIDDNPTDYPDYNKSQDVNTTTQIVGGLIMDVSNSRHNTTDFRNTQRLGTNNC